MEGGGITGTGGFSGTTGGATGAVVQALRSNNNAKLKKLIWFFIEFWLQLNPVNNGSHQNVDIGSGSRRRPGAVDFHCVVDHATQKR